jgi:dipeptidyl aminopeptidase/acylaminoacyl peptidase
VALLGASGGVAELEGTLGHLDQSSRVQAVCDWFGPTDFRDFVNRYNPNSPEAKLIGGPLKDNMDKVVAASPVTYVTRDDPPFLIMHGDQDRVVPLRQSQLLTDALKQAGVPVTFVTIAGAGHGSFARIDGGKYLEQVRAFFDRYLKPASTVPQG